jgi:hypothetical protein
LKELVPPVGLTVLLGGLVWLLVLTAAWPPSGAWWLVLLLVVVAVVVAGALWVDYSEEQAIQREIRERKRRLDKPVRAQEAWAEEEPVRPEVVEPQAWPPPPDQQSF